MKSIIIAALMFTVSVFFCNCGEDKNPGERAGSNDTTAKTPGDTTEKTVIPVYAIWQRKDAGPYDGLYDSSSGYIRICETNEELHVDDPSQLTIRSEEKCYKQGKAYAMMVFKRDSLPPLFVTVLHVDSVNKQVVVATDAHDTIATSVNMNEAAFHELNKQYQQAHPKQEEVRKIRRYYSEDKKIENEEKKKRLLRVQPR
jgi:hypothetical protein